MCICECVCVCTYNPLPATQEKTNLHNKNTPIFMGKNKESLLGLGPSFIALRRAGEGVSGKTR